MSSKAKRKWTPEPLPRGRHKLSREEVRASQRRRLLEAMGEVVMREGYEATTVPKVVAAARVSTNTFYEFFEDKTDCFIARCQEGAEELFEELASFARADDWITALEQGLHAYLRFWRERDALTHAYLIELPAAGHRAIEERERQLERFSVVLRYMANWARAEQPELPPLSEVELAIAVAAPGEIVAREVRAGRLDRLFEIEDDLRYLLIKLLADDATARRARERAKRRSKGNADEKGKAKSRADDRSAA